MEIRPSRLSLNDYEIKLNRDGQSIAEVLNTNMGAVEFTGMQLDENVSFSFGMTM